MRARVVGVAGPVSGVAAELDEGELSIGRDTGCDLTLADKAVSRRHCIIAREGDGYRLTDLQSRHGTHVNGEAIGSRLLADEDRIALGRSVLIFQETPEVTAEGTVSVELSEADVASSSTQQLNTDQGVFLRPEQVLPALEESERLATDLRTLRRISAELHSIGDTDGLARRLLELVSEVIPAERGGVLLLDPSTDARKQGPVFDAIYSWGRASGADWQVRLSRTVAGQVILDRTALLSNGVLDSPVFSMAPSVEQGRIRSVLCVPLCLFDRVVGVLYFDSSDPRAPFDEGHLELVTAIAGMAAMPLELSRSADAVQEVPAEEEAVTPEQETLGRVVLLLRPERPLHLGDVLAMLDALELLDAKAYPRTALFLDYGPAARKGQGNGLTEAWLDRLAILPAGVQVARASTVPSIARLAAVVAATLRGSAAGPAQDARDWFQQILLAASLVVACSSYVILEPPAVTGSAPSGEAWDPGGELELARELASRINKKTASTWPRPSPVVSAVAGYGSLDGKGPMGTTPRGAILVSDSAKDTARKIRSARTDARSGLDPSQELSPEVRNLLLLHHALTGEPTTRVLERLESKGYGALKGELADAAEACLEPLRERRAELAEVTADEIFAAGDEALEQTGRELAELLSRSPGVIA